MTNLLEVVRKIRDEFRTHVSSGNANAFEISAGDQAELSAQMQILQTKKQSGTITVDEKLWLKEIEMLQKDIQRFNPRTEPPPTIVPKVSSVLADEVIRNLDEQFEDKVMKKISAKVGPKAAAPWEVRDFQVPVEHDEHGENLSDYLSKLRGNFPEEPFGDQDSQMDLSKVAAETKNHAT